ncbi:MAG: hypothetical protein LBH42_07760 [Treponema sp.]|jgi:hypothetical protein|nr:hypothetical protein [Treponema sp.]
MNITLQQTERLLLEGNQTFKSLGFSMLLTNLKTFHKMMPLRYTLEDCNTEINAFLEKFKAVLTEDYETIAQL